MCCRSNKSRETSYKLSSLPINLSLNINNDQQIDQLNLSDLHINDHLALDQYLDTLTNSDQNTNHNSMTDRNSTIDV